MCFALVATASYALMRPKTDHEEIGTTQSAIPIPPPQTAPTKITEPLASAAPEFNQQTYHIKSGENLDIIFSKLLLNKTALHKILHANKIGKAFSNIAAGKTLLVKTNQAGELEELTYDKNIVDTLIATRSGDDFTVEIKRKKIDREIASAQAIIHSSLFQDGKVAGLPDKLIMQLADIFAWDIDFALGLRDGDQFTVLYEKQSIGGKTIDTEILAAEFNHQGRTYQAVRYKDKNGKISFYTPNGKSMRKAFLSTPVDYARISSRFNLKRKHPVLNKIRAHKGVDYAARTGTPVKSTSDGKIIFRGRQRGYGRVVIVQHGKKYSTLYAHLSKFRKGQRRSSKVKQGEIIGYVGQSGLATGPHLHYEFRINGKHKNPLTVRLPTSPSIDKKILADFKQQTQPLLSQLDEVRTTLVASSN
jgi:murein DD-endopeptidase MepM/ murein hydrolase activator NlpD